MMIHKKLDFIFTSIFYAIVAFFLYGIGFDFSWIVYVLGISIVVGWMAFRMIRVYQYSNIIPKIVFVSLYIFGAGLFLSSFPTLGISARLVFILATAAFLYVLLLAANVFFISERRAEEIPLIQPAKTVVFIAIVFSVFLWATLIYKFPFLFSIYPVVAVVLTVLLFLIFYIVLISSIRWFLQGIRVGEEAIQIREQITSAQVYSVFVLWAFSVVLLFFPYEAFGRAMIVSGIAYVATNAMVHYINHSLKKRMLIESLLMLIVLFVLVYLV